jgi:carboxypeptidase Taq
MEKKLAELKAHLQEVDDLNSAASVLYWDQSTYMPPGGAPARGRQLATLARLAHEKFTDPAVGRLLDELEAQADDLPYDSDEAGLLRVTRRDYDRSTKIPPQLMAELTEHGTASYQAWTEARPANDFATMRPFLEKTVELSRRVADCFPGYDHIADPLISFADEGMKAESIRVLFGKLREQLVPLVQAITGTANPGSTNPASANPQAAGDGILSRHFPEAGQLAFAEAIIKDFGYDFQRGRQDKTHHPYMTKFSLGDVRITTRVDENDLGNALFSTLHESGHAMYEQGIDQKFEGTPLANGTSAGVHESQSRLWENQVGRSRGFWQFYYPKLQATFPDQLGDVPLDSFYRAVNKVQRSLIRTEADQVTYDLHVMLRFDLELALLEGSLAVKDLPDAWHGRYESDLGVRAPDDRDGVLQDVHWYSGIVGGLFQGYTLGNILAATLYQEALKAHPEIPAEITTGKFDTIHNWLRENIYRHGSKFTPDELVERITGRSLSIDPYISYLRSKFGELYRLS